MAAQAILAVESVTVSYGGNRAVDNASIGFEQGKITGLIGPNGSGKSTLVNLMSGQVHARQGKVRLSGNDISRWRPDQIVKVGLARTYQIPRFPPALTVGEIIDVPLVYTRRSAATSPVELSAGAIAHYCGIAQRVGTPAKMLSVTELRRLEIARALACAPAVILLDEVMAGLSLQDAASIIALVRQISAAGITVVIIEHVMRIIAEICDEVVVLNSGSLLATGKPLDVLAKPAVQEAYLGKRFRL